MPSPFDRGADGVEAELLIRVGPLRIVNAGDDVWDLEDVLGDLRGHDVPVVAFRHGDKTVSVLGAGAAQDVYVCAVADHLVAFELSRQNASCRGARKGVRIAIDDDDFMTRTIHVGCDLRADTTTPDDEELQRRLIIGTTVGGPFRSSRRPGAQGLLAFGRVRFPFTFIGILALAIGVWVVLYLVAHRSLDALSAALAGFTALLCFGFGGYVLIRRVIRGPQH